MSLTLRHRSLAIRLPLGMAALVLCVCGLITAAVYYQVRQSALTLAGGRLAFAAQHIQGLLSTSLRTRLQGNEKVAQAPDVAAYVAAPTPQGEAKVRKILAAVPPGNGRSAWRVANETGVTLFTTKDWNDEPVDDTTTAATLAASPGVSPFKLTSDGKSGFYDCVTAITKDGAHAGWLIERRWMAATAPNLPVLEGLIGSQARLFIGNADGDVWTDFTKLIPAIPSEVSTSLTPYDQPGTPLLVRGATIEGVPWVLAAALPTELVLAPVRRFLIAALVTSAVVVALGTLIAWLVSRRITGPLKAVTEAAESIAASGTWLASSDTSGDEISRLQSSFEAMSARVKQSQEALALMIDELEARVKARTAELEHTNQELQAFSYSVSHDLRAPVRAITGFVGILIEEHGRELSPEARRCLDVVTKRARQMGQLIDDLLALSQVGRRQIGREPIDMNRLLTEVAEEARSAEPGRQVELELGKVPAAAGESALIRQVLLNLLQNAMKFTRTRPVARIEAGAYERDGEIVYFVRDNGVGFPMQYSGRVFDPFHRLHAETDFEGTGIGLAIVQRIVARHGGRVWTESAEDQGAAFYFTLAARHLEAA